MILPAISIKQPWAYAILNLGKDVENRSWRLPQKYVGKPVLIHAGSQPDKDAKLELGFRELAAFDSEDLATGGIIGMLEFDGCCANYTSEWAERGFYHWDIRAAICLPFLACKGRLGFFEVDYDCEDLDFHLERLTVCSAFAVVEKVRRS